MCGLKHDTGACRLFVERVTPHVGVWIETYAPGKSPEPGNVTPHVGVWIETFITQTILFPGSVTPHVGVWIETDRFKKWLFNVLCHTSCRCVD